MSKKLGRPEAHPLLKKVVRGLRLPQWVADKVETLDTGLSESVEKALIKTHKWKPPTKQQMKESE